MCFTTRYETIMKQFKRSLSLILAVVMLLSMVYIAPAAVNAAASDYISTSYAASLSVKTTKAVPLMTAPTTASTAKYSLPVNTTLTVKALHKNTSNTYWYEVLFYNQTLYIDATATTMIDHLVGDITTTNMVSPASLADGESFPIGGTIASSLNKLGTITAAMYWGNDLTIEPKLSASATASNNSYTLDSSTIDSNLSFNTLATGVYTYTVSAEAISYYINANGALTESVKTVVVERQRCIITDYTNPNDITGWGVDVSVWNGSIDWSLAKNDLDFAILRSSYEETTDTRFHEYASGCEQYGIPFGIYVYSYAESVAEAEAEAKHAISLVKNYDMMKLPIFFDAEDPVVSALGASKIREVTKAFIEVVREAGYTPGIYTTSSWFNNYYTTSYFDSVAKWVAQIDGYYGGYTCSYNGGLHFWQYSWEGSCSGIYSSGLDVNYTYDLLPGMTNDTTYRSKCTAYPSNLMVTTNASVTMRKFPCNASVDSTSTSVTTVAANASLHATALYKNTAGEYWYQVENGSSVGYIPASSATASEFLYDDLGVIEPEMATNLDVGAGYALDGTMVSQYNNIATAYAKVYSGEDTLATPVLSSSGANNSNRYDLYASTVCDNMIFSDLSAGYYTYEISADVKNYYVSGSTLASKTENVVVWTTPFTVGNAAITPPSNMTCVHSVVTDAAVAATCTTTGLTAGSHCSKCGVIITAQTVIPATGHKYSSKTTAGDCQNYAHTTYTCSVCGDSYNTFADELMSDWQTTKPDVDDSLIETKTQYRYSDYETTTSYNEALSGYTQTGSEWIWQEDESVYYVPSWPSGFDTTSDIYNEYDNNMIAVREGDWFKVEENSNQVAGYLYYHWCYTGSYYSQASSSGSYTTFHAYYSETSPDNYTCDTSDYSYKTSDTCCSNSNWFFVTEVYQQNTSTYFKLYHYERWTDYSDWSDTVYTASDTRQVETRKVYRYVTSDLGEHNYVNGVCSVCGDTNGVYEPDYYLVGYINGADYGCEWDWENLGDYKFVNGTLTATFTQDSYVFIKTGDNANWYMAESYISGNTGTFKNTDTGTAEKMYIPGGVEVTFTLTENSDGSLTLSYVTASTECSHSYASKVTTAASCTTNGVRTYTCSKCGDSYTETIAATGHSYTSVVTAPTCTASGYTTYTCSSCGNSYKSNTTAATGHSYTSEVTTAATCTINGVRTYTCSKCGDSYTETIAATGHSYTSVVTAPTCTASGYTTYTCSTCGYSYTANQTAATGHSYVGGTCTTCGATDATYAPDYYLVGFINGVDYGCESDSENLGQYKFVNGKLTATFTEESYVFVKTGDNLNWYMAEFYITEDNAVLYHTSTGAMEKMLVPGGVEVTLTLVENGDGSLSLSYTQAETPVVENSKDIKWQVTSGTNASSTSTNLRFLTWVDSPANYSSVTFNVTINGKTSKLKSTTAYTAILASGTAIRNPANIFKESTANYFVTYTLKNVPSSYFDIPIVVTVTWTDLEGNEKTSESKTIVISSDWA